MTLNCREADAKVTQYVILLPKKCPEQELRPQGGWVGRQRLDGLGQCLRQGQTCPKTRECWWLPLTLGKEAPQLAAWVTSVHSVSFTSITEGGQVVRL